MFSSLILITTALTLAGAAPVIDGGEYEPTWESLSQHETPQWFSDAKFGKYDVEYVLDADSAGDAAKRSHGEPKPLSHQFRQFRSLGATKRGSAFFYGSTMTCAG